MLSPNSSWGLSEMLLQIKKPTKKPASIKIWTSGSIANLLLPPPEKSFSGRLDHFSVNIRPDKGVRKINNAY